jgi:hypothetical protein
MIRFSAVRVGQPHVVPLSPLAVTQPTVALVPPSPSVQSLLARVVTPPVISALVATTGDTLPIAGFPAKADFQTKPADPDVDSRPDRRARTTFW